MSARERQRERQRKREERMLEQVNSGKAIRVTYEERQKKLSLPNRVNMASSVEEEIEDRQNTIEKATAVYRQMLPPLMNKLGRIKDPRQPGKIKHKMTVLMLYGILMFVFQSGSRRETNRSMNKIRFENLKAMFPELETMPHADTLARLLEVIEVCEIQACMIELLKDLIKRKKFRNNLYNNRLLIAIDGTQKFYRPYQWDDKFPGLVRHVGEEKKEQHYVYVLESVVILENGITLPLFSEFLTGKDMHEGFEDESFDEEQKQFTTEEKRKQDCERKAFNRIATTLKKLFRNTSISVVVDGLYACGPIIQTCIKNNWGYMIVLKPDAMSAVWDDATGLMDCEPQNRHQVMWGERTQNYLWANDIEYEYKKGKVTRKLVLHVVLCYETWIENHSRSTKNIEECRTRYAWISSTPINHSNVFRRCTKIGRYRWKIENSILTEKHQGYSYQHCFSYTWQAMEGYHYLMKIGRFMNVLAFSSELLIDEVRTLGIMGLIEYLALSCKGSLLDKDRIEKVVNKKQQWRLAIAS